MKKEKKETNNEEITEEYLCPIFRRKGFCLGENCKYFNKGLCEAPEILKPYQRRKREKRERRIIRL